MTRFKTLLFILISCITCCAQVAEQQLNSTDPVAAGYKANFFKQIGKNVLDSVPSIGSFVVWKNNGIVYEQYFNGASDTTNFKVKSVTKSVVSALTGIANDRKLLVDLNTPVFNLFPEYATDLTKNKNIAFPELIKINDSLKRLVTLRHMLTMQTGYLWYDNNPLSSRVYNSSVDPVENTLNFPFEAEPGTTFRYCTPATHVVAVYVAKCVKENLKKFADTALFKPLGITISSWATDALGRTLGGTELSMRSRDMLKFGLLYLNEGRVGDKQLISKAWINESTSEQVKLDEWDVLPGANGYGYFWWRRKTNGHQAFVASGYGGQLICVIPDLKMVVVTTCIVNEKNRGRSEIKRLHKIIDKIVKATK